MTDGPKPGRMGRIALVASLAVNVLLAGAIIGSVASGRAGPARSFELQIGPLGQVLTKDQRAEVGRDLRRAIRAAGIERPSRQAVLANAVTLLEADVFDAAAFESTIRGQYQRVDQVRDVALVTFSAYLSDLPLADRQAIARSLEEQARRGGPKSDHSRDGSKSN